MELALVILAVLATHNPKMVAPPHLENPAEKRNTLTVALEKQIRDDVYDRGILLGTVGENGLLIDAVSVPKSLRDGYAKHPDAVLTLLLSIVDGAAPRDSMKAAAYALSLIDSPSGGAVSCVRLFDKDKYDEIESGWATTPRKHWITVIQDKVRPKGKK